jgi:hypothetical protein
MYSDSDFIFCFNFIGEIFIFVRVFTVSPLLHVFKVAFYWLIVIVFLCFTDWHYFYLTSGPILEGIIKLIKNQAVYSVKYPPYDNWCTRNSTVYAIGDNVTKGNNSLKNAYFSP